MKFRAIDTIMPIVLEGQTYYLILKETDSLDELNEWLRIRSMSAYKIISLGP